MSKKKEIEDGEEFFLPVIISDETKLEKEYFLRLPSAASALTKEGFFDNFTDSVDSFLPNSSEKKTKVHTKMSTRKSVTIKHSDNSNDKRQYKTHERHKIKAPPLKIRTRNSRYYQNLQHKVRQSGGNPEEEMKLVLKYLDQLVLCRHLLKPDLTHKRDKWYHEENWLNNMGLIKRTFLFLAAAFCMKKILHLKDYAIMLQDLTKKNWNRPGENDFLETIINTLKDESYNFIFNDNLKVVEIYRAFIGYTCYSNLVDLGSNYSITNVNRGAEINITRLSLYTKTMTTDHYYKVAANIDMYKIVNTSEYKVGDTDLIDPSNIVTSSISTTALDTISIVKSYERLTFSVIIYFLIGIISAVFKSLNGGYAEALFSDESDETTENVTFNEINSLITEKLNILTVDDNISREILLPLYSMIVGEVIKFFIVEFKRVGGEVNHFLNHFRTFTLTRMIESIYSGNEEYLGDLDFMDDENYKNVSGNFRLPAHLITGLRLSTTKDTRETFIVDSFTQEVIPNSLVSLIYTIFNTICLDKSPIVDYIANPYEKTDGHGNICNVIKYDEMTSVVRDEIIVCEDVETLKDGDIEMPTSGITHAPTSEAYLFSDAKKYSAIFSKKEKYMWEHPPNYNEIVTEDGFKRDISMGSRSNLNLLCERLAMMSQLVYLPTFHIRTYQFPIDVSGENIKYLGAYQDDKQWGRYSLTGGYKDVTKHPSVEKINIYANKNDPNKGTTLMNKDKFKYNYVKHKCHAWVDHSLKNVYIVFRGTHTGYDWSSTDKSICRALINNDDRVLMMNDLFRKIYIDLQEYGGVTGVRRDDYKYFSSGHSLGGFLGCMAAVTVKQNVYLHESIKNIYPIVFDPWFPPEKIYNQGVDSYVELLDIAFDRAILSCVTDDAATSTILKRIMEGKFTHSNVKALSRGEALSPLKSKPFTDRAFPNWSGTSYALSYLGWCHDMSAHIGKSNWYNIVEHVSRYSDHRLSYNPTGIDSAYVKTSNPMALAVRQEESFIRPIQYNITTPMDYNCFRKRSGIISISYEKLALTRITNMLDRIKQFFIEEPDGSIKIISDIILSINYLPQLISPPFPVIRKTRGGSVSLKSNGKNIGKTKKNKWHNKSF
jgi:hypothetical protein